ncbi:MAG: M48 family metallopeptidase [Candidatus Ruthia sp.]|jgi:Zn-dependent protease with chaperone function|nr:M48 family metallopeptidase [Candidatus Ruthturnera sp.]
MKVVGYWYASNSSKRNVANIDKLEGGLYLSIDEQESKLINLSDFVLSDRVGSANRRIVFSDGSVFETQDNDAIDVLFNNKDLFHRLESKWKWAVSAVVLFLVIGLVIVRVGFPWASKEIAYALPIYINEKLSKGTLEFLDEYILDESELSQAQQQDAYRDFDQLVSSIKDKEFHYKLHIRKMGEEANAFSLPSGEIILTDGLLQTAENTEQIDAILLHEIGHVKYRHGLQQVVHSSLISTAISMMTSDLTVLEDLLVVMPVFLVESSYSRSHEYEADEFLFDNMTQLNKDPIHFANILDAITRVDEIDDNLEESIKYFSSHPETKKRINNAMDRSKQYRSNN